ncbi:MAG TPA: MBL fold metallo-hydrolase [Streptosporangiaceae bacterium]|jgi:L-ascorbate metabolism protein UlaG (beta-lactamase superfamily)
MRLTKFTHSCVRLESGHGVLVIDPGCWSEPAALDGATAVLVTHEHSDHLNAAELASRDIPVYAPAAAAIEGLAYASVASGDRFTAGGFAVRAVGGRHAVIHGGEPDCANLGYVIEDSYYHPGDSLTVPGAEIDTLLVPMQASWLKTTEAISFVQAVAPRRAFGMHEGQLNDRGLRAANRWLSYAAGAAYRYLAPGETA